MDRAAAVNDCEPHIAVVGNIRRRIDLMPHASESRACSAGIRFDLAQISEIIVG